MQSKEINLSQTFDYNCQLSVLSRSDGSSLVSQGRTVVAAAVYGPIEPKINKVYIDKAAVDVTYNPKSGPSCVGDRLIESLICNISEVAILTSQYRRARISINIQEVQDNGGLLACCINATCLALLHSGICMNHLFAAVTCTVDSSDQSIKILPAPPSTTFEDKQAKNCIITFVFENTSNRIVACNTSGVIDESVLQECTVKCREASGQVFDFYKTIVQRYSVSL